MAHDDHVTEALPAREAGGGALRLVVATGASAGSAIDLDGPIRVGTSESCDLRVDDRSVSRVHLVASPHELGARIVDQESRNGTWIDQVRVVDVELPPGASVRIGNTVLRVEEAKTPPSRGAQRSSFGRFVGAAPVLQPVYARLEKAAPTQATILLEGESGTGKDVLAEAIHDHSTRASGPFVVLDCGAVPETLIESELFGHERGAFTGADRARPGAFVAADGGTLFLDEIGELPLAHQTRLLRALESRKVRPLGGQRAIEVDVRVIAATNRNLDREVEEGRFRLDLFHRLAVVVIRVPPLRERKSDLPLLLAHFHAELGATAPLPAELLARAQAYPWPGNVRELRNHVERAAILGVEASVTTGPASSGASDPFAGLLLEGVPFRVARARVLDAFTRVYVERMLARHGGNVSAAAREAGIARRYFQVLKSG